MELFAFAGLSNSAILLTAAATFGCASILSLATRSIAFSQAGSLDRRIGKLEIRTAASEEYRQVIDMAADILDGVASHATTPVVEMFEDINVNSSWFRKNPDAEQQAHSLLDELKRNIELATAIARPIQNMFENGAIEVKSQRQKLGTETRRTAAAISTKTWDRHGATILASGVPSATVTLMVECFAQVRALKQDALSLSPKSSVNQIIGVLHQSAALLATAGNGVDILRGITEPPAEEMVAEASEEQVSTHADAEHADAA